MSAQKPNFRRIYNDETRYNIIMYFTDWLEGNNKCIVNRDAQG